VGGHSHWAGIKHKKALVDAKRGKVWTRIVREITIAAKLGGGSPDGNPRLRKAMDDAKEANMPADNIKRAIQKGTGEIPGASYEELTYEGYGPGGAAVFCEATTDNKNRTTGEIRKIFENHGGKLGGAGSVAWMFQPKGYLTVKKSAAEEDALMSLALDNGAEDFKAAESEVYEIVTAPSDFERVRASLAAQGIKPETAELSMIPSTSVKVEGPDAQKLLELVEQLETHDDIKSVHANFDIPDKVLAQFSK